ncbi:MAG: nucleotidyltransferase domain-containing protein [Anaerolineae bacterium]
MRSLSTSVVRWPDAVTVERALQEWAASVAAADPRVMQVGFFGSYARGDWGVGSDVDLLVIVDRACLPFAARGAAFDATALPVPADVLVYTEEEWQRLSLEPGFGRTAAAEVVWVYLRE